ncbi:sulfate ABC transporter permease subunit CysW [Telmatobacter bradus]|uniref:sulfate ABC transporter permease subunit CysW n=1 Tax=Telmatobacter bradus TaxID=474953 RepID=UPI003B42C5FD
MSSLTRTESSSLAIKAGRAFLILLALAFVALFLVLPLVSVFVQAFAQGWKLYAHTILQEDVVSALKLTGLVAAIAVPLNVVFGIAASWAITRFDFAGKNLLTTLIDIPLAVSPVVAGLMYVEVFGLHGWLGPWLYAHDLHIIFAVPGIVLATVFVTFPFVARELIPFMQAQGSDEEEAAVVLGAGGWSLFWRVTLPNIKWALLYGTILAASRAIGEFGAVSVLSGHIRGRTTTLPLEVEMLYNEYSFTAAFAAATLLSLAAVVTLVLKKIIEATSGIHDRHKEEQA